ncbi:farnesyl pyrophosphate synthase-like [Corticium candelabrum]|uniref:farnesyl pyrophosphate synthase-like n=1 Tax=Corticium candelabrum TaxID=121492 RepID=UPI002E25E345|nr:farnesyl pyrophosphate synthase-like [Corticium candelabrum]
MDVHDFDKAFENIIEDCLPNETEKELSVPRQWLRKVLEYNVPHGKKNRGLSVAASYRHLLRSERPFTDDEIHKLQVLGWCVEMLQAWLLVADDIMDQSHTRRGKPCWFRNDDVGLVGLNDAFLLESCVYKLLKKHFRQEAYYTNLVELFMETSHQTELGQTLDLLTSPENSVNLEHFTLDKYRAIVKYKTAFYSFYCPVALAMHMAGLTSEDDFTRAGKILLSMGEFFQIQDDFLDCYGDPAVTGKIGTDIEDNKCSWLVVQALKKVTAEQREVLEKNYGRKDEACVSCVKQLYSDLCLQKVYHDYEESSYSDLMASINTECGSLPKGMFIEFADRIYKRKK